MTLQMLVLILEVSGFFHLAFSCLASLCLDYPRIVCVCWYLKYSGLFGVSLLCWVSGVAVALDTTADGLALNNGTTGAAEI